MKAILVLIILSPNPATGVPKSHLLSMTSYVNELTGISKGGMMNVQTTRVNAIRTRGTDGQTAML